MTIHALSCFCDQCIALMNGEPPVNEDVRRYNELKGHLTIGQGALQGGAVIGMQDLHPGKIYAASDTINSARLLPGMPGQVMFAGMVQVNRIENGYLVAIATEMGATPKVFVAGSIEEANGRILAEMVAFRLEGSR